METSSSGYKRLFLAIEPSEDTRRKIAESVRAVQPTVGIRWVGASQVHLTVKFFGETSSDRVAEIESALRARIVDLGGLGCAPFELEARGAGEFSSRGIPRVLWVGLRGDLQALERWVKEVEECLSSLGFPRESRPFHPHLSVARVKDPRGRQGARLWLEEGARQGSFGSFRVGELVLFESVTGPRGSVYSALARFPLGAENRSSDLHP